ncbi:MAG: tetratricopeptide repeat protein [Verrucomicrobia bacterium]|nr:tetratricopeptide repeat protein [Verrucomicrobiota bacterium]
MSNIFVSTCLVLLATQGAMVAPEKLSSQEAFFLRRVTEFWKDKDFGLVKKQIEDFLAAHPQSAIHDNLHAILADILYQERDYKRALELYEKLADVSLQQKTLTRKSQCLYLLGQYDAVIGNLTAVLQGEGTSIESKEELQFLLADSLFRKLQSLEDSAHQKELALQARPFLLSLYETSYKEKVLLPLAEVHRILQENPEASSLYVLLADKMPDKKEEILLQAASLQLTFNKDKAIETYQQIVDLGKTKAPEAAYNELLLLFQENRFADLVQRASILSSHLAADKKPLFDFCLGRSYFKLEKFSDAAAYFERYIQEESESTSYKRAAFLTLITCSQKIQDPDLFDRTLEQFLAAFPRDEEAGKALLLHAQTALQKGSADQATADLGRLLLEFPEIPEKETLLYDHALLLSKIQKWEDSRDAFLAYLKEFPETSRSDLIWSSIVHCSVQELKAASSENLLAKKEQLASDLLQALGKPNLFTPEEQANYRFLAGQLLFDLKNFQEALNELSLFATQYPEHSSIPEALLLQAHIHRELNSPPEIFAIIAERALAIAKDPENKTALRLQLFNTYLTTKEYDKAAEHLYQCHLIDGVAIQQENELWLAHYYFEGAQQGNAEHENRAVKLYQKILKTDDHLAVHFDPAQTYLESEVMKFAELLQPAAKKQLLTSLREMQVQNSSQPWKLERQTLFELGKLYLSLNEPDNALKSFDELIAPADAAPTYISNAALLEKNRILLARCPASDRNESNPTITNILLSLKDLQIQKKLSCEPLHLEAALEYADIRTQMSSPEARRESAIFFLNRIKDDFNAKTDPISQEYHEARLRFPEKDHLFQNYMKCIEAEIFCIEAELAKELNDLDKARRSEDVALALLQEVLQASPITPYLKNRAQLNLKALTQ